jgi:hypothetical protein
MWKGIEALGLEIFLKRCREGVSLGEDQDVISRSRSLEE